MNSFYEIEPRYFDYWNRHCEPKAWRVGLGSLCLAEPPSIKFEFESENYQKPPYMQMQWLDQKVADGKSVLYVAFGNESELDDGFEERVKKRGILMRDWVDQREVLGHQSDQVFLSHCGWNSVIENKCAKVQILAWPMMAEQPLNARMVMEEIKIGLRVEISNESVKGFVK
ncbi:unnamed protein product [Ilex paraguariensis]|uniref:Uncharacterized protein n=1 Tax=Ilex paraguariensis TaxID=185542 RepID=A0ABC8SZQ0_9AQUA